MDLLNSRLISNLDLIQVRGNVNSKFELRALRSDRGKVEAER